MFIKFLLAFIILLLTFLGLEYFYHRELTILMFKATWPLWVESIVMFGYSIYLLIRGKLWEK